MSKSYEVGSRRRLALQLAVLIAAVAVHNAARTSWNDLAYYDWLRRAFRGEIMLRGAAGPAFVNGNARGTQTSGTTIAVTIGWTPLAGNVLIAVVGTNVYTVTSITQTNVTWTFQKSSTYSNAHVEIWYGVIGASPDTSVTVNLSGTVNGGIANICEFSGMLTSGFLDKTASDAWPTALPIKTGTTATTTQAVELLIGGTQLAATSIGHSGPANGFTMFDGAYINTYYSSGFLYKIVAATGTYSSGCSSPASGSYGWAGCIATFKGQVPINISDTGSGSEGFGNQAALGAADSGLAVDAVLRLLSIVGTVKDSIGNPVAGATVWLFRTSDGAYMGVTTTDGAGGYYFSVPESTQYFVRAHHDSYGGDRVFGVTDRTLAGS
ncbi:MAG: carboxypeptidase-like regulatory domain-containing protein [Candidatus Bathyarchaeia archaeon]